MIWKAYILGFACAGIVPHLLPHPLFPINTLLIKIAALVIGYVGTGSIATTVEVSMISLITICLMSGLPFGLTFLLAIINMIMYEIMALQNHANAISMVRSNALFVSSSRLLSSYFYFY